MTFYICGDDGNDGKNQRNRCQIPPDRHNLNLHNGAQALFKEQIQRPIDKQEGAITNHLRAPLPTNSTFEVTTPVGVMAVIGTTYRVTVMKNPDGSHSATLEVLSDSVGVSLKNPDQTIHRLTARSRCTALKSMPIFRKSF